MKFNYTESTIEWEYNTEKKIYSAEGIEFASVGNKSIYIEICGDLGYEYRYIDLNGKNILWYTDTGELSIFYSEDGQKMKIQLNKISDVAIINDGFYVLTLEKTSGEILEYSKIGELIKKYTPPLYYSFYRFSEFDSELSVICQGDNHTSDKFGRNDWKFIYNKNLGYWEKKSLSY